MHDQLLGLPWDAWSAVAGIGTFLVGSTIAWIAARASYLQFYGALQIEFETTESVGDKAGFTVECLIHNRSPFSIVVYDMEVFAWEWAQVAVRTGLVGRDGYVLVQARIEPHSSKVTRFYLTGREGRPMKFRVTTKWSRHGLSGRLKSTTAKAYYRPRVDPPKSGSDT